MVQSLASLLKRPSVRDALLVGVVVTVAALFGILSRPIGFLSLFWPANAILLGLFYRIPRLARWPSWIAAIIGFLIADLSTGDGLVPTLWLTAANITGVFCGWFAFHAMRQQYREAAHPLAFLYMLAAAAFASLGAALVGCWAAPLLLERDPLWGLGFWFASELVSYVAVLPVVLTIPGPARLIEQLRPGRLFSRLSWADLIPGAVLLCSVLVAHWVGGPGAIAIPAPALLWCALRYPVFPTAVLTLVLSAWQMITVVNVIEMQREGIDPVYSAISLRFGLALFALAPLTVASVSQLRNELMQQLNRAISHDHLTGTLARATFVERAMALLQSGRGSAVMMLDLDHFKHINDRFGHSVGDLALVAFAQTTMAGLRHGDLFGRIGGEEFAIVLVDADRQRALQAAERIRADIEALAVGIGHTEPLRLTVSIGVALAQPAIGFDRWLASADRALYCAKNAGRNQVSLDGGEEPPGSGRSRQVRSAA